MSHPTAQLITNSHNMANHTTITTWRDRACRIWTLVSDADGIDLLVDPSGAVSHFPEYPAEGTMAAAILMASLEI